MSKQAKGDGKRRVAIVGSVVSGRSGNSWYGQYTGSASVMQAIGAAGDIEIYINSPGGSVFAGFEILNALNAAVTSGRKVDIYVSAMAASIASYISTGVKGATVYMAENAKLMFHAPWTYTMGSKTQLTDTADLLGKMEDDIARAIDSRGVKVDREWFAAGRAKWLSAAEAVAMKLADKIGNPPQALIEFVSKPEASSGGYRDEDFDDKAEKTKERGSARLSAADRFAATASFEGYLQSLAQEQFGEGTEISDLAEGSFRATKQDGSSALLKYRGDSLNIVAIDWESAAFAPKQEQNMSEQEKLDAAAAKAKTDAQLKADADAKLAAEQKAEADAKQKEEAAARAKADADAAQRAKDEADAKLKADAEVKAKAGLTDDMIAFAQKQYKVVRDAHIVTIKAAKGCEFMDEELAKYDLETLAKMAKLTAKADAPDAPAAKTDNTLIAPAPAAKGTGGSLPPPE